jgi:outer membrane protein assembly factor BamE (lipoprotein component of BamABCDE complex)
MKTMSLSLALAVTVMALVACSSAVTQTKLNQITNGMKADQVTTLLGQPTRIDQSEITGLTGQVYHYVSRQGDARVVLINGAVFETSFDAAGGHA